MEQEFVNIVIPIMNRPAATDESIVEQMMTQMEYLKEVGAIKGEVQDLIKDYSIDKDGGYINVTIPTDAMIWADKLETVGAGVSQIFKVTEEWFPKENAKVTEDGVAIFSVATINERLRIAKRAPKVQFRYLILDYKRYWNSKKSQLMKDAEQLKALRGMFLSDMMRLITEILPEIQEGKQLATLVGVSQVSPKLNKVARELSLAYKRALKVEGSTGQINKSIYQKLKGNYTEFMTALMEQVFPGMGGDQDEKESSELNPGQVVEQVEESRKYSYTSDGRIKLF